MDRSTSETPKRLKVAGRLPDYLDRDPESAAMARTGACYAPAVAGSVRRVPRSSGRKSRGESLAESGLESVLGETRFQILISDLLQQHADFPVGLARRSRQEFSAADVQRPHRVDRPLHRHSVNAIRAMDSKASLMQTTRWPSVNMLGYE
jgi:hypothetical protein